ncbi:DUF2461 domain-containing protein [Angustibacter peucedani]
MTTSVPRDFTGFSPRATAFYAELEATCTKAWWDEHKSEYEAEVRGPLLALTAALEPEFGPAKLFRPYRDTRFSHDKTPYKTHQGALVGDGQGVGYYLQLDSDGLLVGGGFRAHSADQVARYRAAVDDDASGERLAAVVATLRRQDFEVEGEQLKTRPRGVAADHPRLELMRNRSLMVLRRCGTPAWLATPQALDVVRDAWRDVRPLRDWVAEHVGSP